MARTFVKRFVALVDILGFKSIVDRMHDDPGLFRTVRDMLKTAARQATRFDKYRAKFNPARRDPRRSISFVADMRLEMTAFSDSFVVSDTHPAWHVLAAVQAIGSHFLEAGIMTRGGIVRGDAYHRGQVLFGPAVNEAYKLEHEVARYPRILVAPDVVKSAWGYHRDLCKGRLFVRDADGSWFVNVIAPTLSGWDALSKRSAAKDELTHQLRVREALMKLPKTAKANPAHLSKVMWLINQFNATAGTEAIDILDGPT